MAYTMDSNLEAGLEMVKEGKKVNKGLALINKSARKADKKGKSYFEIGRIVREGCTGIEPDAEMARQYYDASCNYFFQEDCDSMDYHDLGDYYYYALGSEPQDKERALEYYRLACKDNDDEVAAKMVEEIEKEKEQPTQETVQEAPEEKPVEEVKTSENPDAIVYPTDIPLLKEDSEEEMLLQAIRMIDNPASTEQERLDGIELAKAASEKGSTRAAILVAFLYEGYNSLLARDLDMARKYYLVAISRGSASAEYRLGLIYLDNSYLFKDDEKGHDLIMDSARKGYPYALNYLGDCFRSRVNDPKNLTVAYRYYSLAGERRLGIAYHNMAEIDASRQDMALSKQHEAYAAKLGYDPVKGTQDPLFFVLH
mgnify:CR=1 FL=1